MASAHSAWAAETSRRLRRTSDAAFLASWRLDHDDHLRRRVVRQHRRPSCIDELGHLRIAPAFSNRHFELLRLENRLGCCNVDSASKVNLDQGIADHSTAAQDSPHRDAAAVAMAILPNQESLVDKS